MNDIQSDLGEQLREVIIKALIEAIKIDDRKMIEVLSWISHPVALQVKL